MKQKVWMLAAFATFGGLVGFWFGGGTGLVGGFFSGGAIGAYVFAAIGSIIGMLLPENLSAVLRYLGWRRN